jgi:hypothetical protein
MDSQDIQLLSTASTQYATTLLHIVPLTAAEVTRFDVFQYNAVLREAYAHTPEVLVHCPVSSASK